MRKFTCALVLLAVTGSLFMLTGCSKKEGGVTAGAVKEGAKAVNFTLKDMQDKEVKLSDYAGKVVLLNFWATWCPPCREEIPSMAKLNEQMAGKPFQMLCVSIDDGGKADVLAFFKKEGVTLPALSDPDSEVGRQYGITGVPESFIIDKQGKIVKKVIGGLDWVSPDIVSFLTNLTSQQP